ncbi:hypothetical protein C900_02177 [Fulvivirga imtechensis AK7]|uniref:Uncharacterized protein n=1 Tax=Fulvivirga imtechensis AK7 TaxID=1237149 RepID=L8JX65_9BACT|nr:hypothetical protein C900_02177 [Fulvivirga imtechensis AK7]
MKDYTDYLCPLFVIFAKRISIVPLKKADAEAKLKVLEESLAKL